MVAAAGVLAAVAVAVAVRKRDDMKIEAMKERAHAGHGRMVPRVIVIHYTADENAANTIGVIAAKGLAHFVIDRAGNITSVVPTNQRAHHAGVSAYDGVQSVNGFSIGIELVNAGPLRRTEDGRFLEWESKREYRGPVVEVPEHKLRWWAGYSPEQIDALAEVVAELKATLPIEAVVGHSEIAVPKGRKIDPGPAFPWERFRGPIPPEVA